MALDLLHQCADWNHGRVDEQSFRRGPAFICNQRPGQIDYIGFGLMALGLATLQILLDKGQELTVLIVVHNVAAVLSAVSLMHFCVGASHTRTDCESARARKSKFRLGTALIALMGVVLTARLYDALLLQTLLGYPALGSGLA